MWNATIQIRTGKKLTDITGDVVDPDPLGVQVEPCSGDELLQEERGCDQPQWCDLCDWWG